MQDETAAALIAELRTLNHTMSELKDEVGRAAAIIAAAQLTAVDASRSEVYANLMDDQLVETAERLLRTARANAAKARSAT